MKFDQKLLMVAASCVALAALNLLRVCISVLVECYSELHRCEQPKRDRDDHQRPSKPNKLFRLLFQSATGNVRKFGGQIHNLRVLLKNSWGNHSRSRQIHRLFDLSVKGVNLILNFFGFAHKGWKLLTGKTYLIHQLNENRKSTLFPLRIPRGREVEFPLSTHPIRGVEVENSRHGNHEPE